MTGWWQTVRGAWDRRQARREAREEKQANKDRLRVWWTEPRMDGVHDTGSIVATPEDLAEIGPFDPVRMPGQRRGRHRADPGEGT